MAVADVPINLCGPASLAALLRASASAFLVTFACWPPHFLQGCFVVLSRGLPVGAMLRLPQRGWDGGFTAAALVVGPLQ